MMLSAQLLRLAGKAKIWAGLWLGLWVLAAPSASAQNSNILSQFSASPPAEKYTVSPGGVDMRTGHYAYRATDLVAGTPSSSGGLELTRLEAQALTGHLNPFGNMSHNWDITLSEKRVRPRIADFVDNANGTDFQIFINFNGRTETFEAYNDTVPFAKVSRTSFSSLSQSGVRDGGGEIYTYRTGDGTTVTFRPLPLRGAGECAAALRCAYPSTVAYADGTTLDFLYDTRTGTGNSARLRAVVSNAGYALLFEYGSSEWGLVTKSCLLNLSEIARPSANTCPASAAYSNSYDYVEFDGKYRLSSVTDALGQISRFTYSANLGSIAGRMDMGFVKAGQSQPWLTNVVETIQNNELADEEVVWEQDFSDQSKLTYTYTTSPTEFNPPSFPIGTPIPHIAGGTYQDATGAITTVEFGFPERPYSMTDSTMLTQPYNMFLWIGDGEMAVEANCLECSGSGSYLYNVAYQTTPGPQRIVDPLGRVTTIDYCDMKVVFPDYEPYTCLVSLPQSVTDPEGNVTSYKYVLSNIVEVKRTPKPSSNLAPTIESATYDCTSGNIKFCTKPLTVTDANGATTNYSYDAAHGGLLTEMKPAPTAGAARPLTVKTYVQKYAYVKNASGALVPAANPIWLLASVTECQTAVGSNTPTCDGSAPQKVSTNQYGADGTANNLLLRGVAVTADGVTRRTCFGYDGFGRKVSETTPNANLTVCP